MAGKTVGIKGKPRDAKPQVKGPFVLVLLGREAASIGLENR